MHKESESYKQDDKGDDDVTYMQITGNINSISKRLLNALMEDDVHVSSCNIRTVFEEIKDQTLNCYGYTNDTDTFNDGMPGYSNEQKRWSAYEEFGGSIYLHLDLFKDVRTSRTEKNIYRLVLEKMAHKYSSQKKIVLGMNSFVTKQPSEWDTLFIKPNPDNVIKMTHGIGKQIDIYGILGDTEDLQEDLEVDLDDFIAQEHGRDVGYDVPVYVPNNNDWSDITCDYPFRPNKRKRVNFFFKLSLYIKGTCCVSLTTAECNPCESSAGVFRCKVAARTFHLF